MSGSNNNKNSSEETVPLAEHEALKKEHETLIKMLELLEETGKKQREEAKEETEKWKNKFVEMEKKVEKLENDIEDLLIPLDESEMNGMDSATAVAKNGNATSNTVSDEGVITISDDDDEGGNEGESNGGYEKPPRQKPVFSFII